MAADPAATPPALPPDARPPGPGDQVFLVDGSSFVFRAYFQSMNQDAKYNYRSDGLPTGAVRLFMTKLYQFINEGAVDVRPTHLAIVFDKAEKTFRNEVYADYKANRKSPPDDLIPQFPLMRDAVRALGLEPVEQSGYEADDVIATYAKQAEAAGADVLIVSADKDLMQLVSPKVKFYDFESGRRGTPGYRPERRIDPAGVEEYFGVPPDKVVEVQALIGDPSDNVPGVPGIGVKTAAQLIGEFGDLETLLHRIGEVKQPKRRELLTLHAEAARTSRRLVVLETAVAVDRPLAASTLPPLDARRLIAFLKAMELNTMVKRVADAYRIDAESVEADPRLRAKGRGTAALPGQVGSMVGGYSRSGGGLPFDTAPAPFTSPLAGEVGVERRDGGEGEAVPVTPTVTLPHKGGGSSDGAGLAATPLPDPPPQGGREPGEEGRESQGADRRAPGEPRPTGHVGDLFGYPAPAPPPEGEDEPAVHSPGAGADAIAAAMAAVPFDPARYEIVTSHLRLDAWLAEATRVGRIALAVMADGPLPMSAAITGIGIAVAPGRAAYIPVGHTDGSADLLGGGPVAGQLDLRAAVDRLRPVLEDAATLKIGHDIKQAVLLLSRQGVRVAPVEDAMLLAYALEAGRRDVSLGGLSDRWLGRRPGDIKALLGSGRAAVTFDRVPIQNAAAHAAEAADIALRLAAILRPRLVAEQVTAVYETMERPMVPVLAAMEKAGVAVDRQVLSRLSHDFAQTMARLEDEIATLAGGPFNIGSPKQLGEILFEKMQIPGGRKTKTGAWSTDADTLEELAADGHPLPARILEWRQVSKLKSTYTDALPDFINPETKRVHTSYALAATPTGRLSSSEPNLQNIPIRTGMGRQIRTAFVAEPGNALISADYSQVELRVLAHMAEIPQLRQAFADGLDIHAMTASEMFGVPVQGMPPEVRSRAKAINFGIIYGISAFGLANQLSIPRAEAKDYIERYFLRFPGIRDYMETTKAYCRENGFVMTVFGRRCHYPSILSKNPAERAFNERAAVNATIQGSAADIIRRAMVRMPGALARAGLSGRMLLQVHDELVFEVPQAEAQATIAVVREIMENAPEPAVRLRVPLRVDARAGADWDAAH